MKKAFPLLSLMTLMFLTFAFTPANATTDITPEMDICNEVETVVSVEDLFGTGRFYGCYVSPAFTNVTYELRPQVQGLPSIFGDIDCDSDLVTLAPFVEYEIWITTNNQIWLFLQWEFCNTGGGNPGVSLNDGVHNVGSIFILC